VRLALFIGLLAIPTAAAAGQTGTAAPTDPAALQRLLVAEDARGTGQDGVDPLLVALEARDTLLRRVAVRGLGRLQRPGLGARLIPLLSDSDPAIRAEAAIALAQSLRNVARGAPSDSAQGQVRDAAAALTGALAREADPAVGDALGESLGRLPFADSGAAGQAERALADRLAQRPAAGLVHGLYTLARARRTTGNLSSSSIALLRELSTDAPDTMARRLAVRTLAAADGLDSATAVRAFRDRDDEVRRMVLRGSGPLPAAVRARLVRRGLADPRTIVRVEAVTASRFGDGPHDCGPLLAAAHDREPYVVLAAIDSLGGGCADTSAALALLRRLAARDGGGGPADHHWQAGAHAVLALARLDTAEAAAFLPERARARRPEVRIYATRAAALSGSRPLLFLLAADHDHNVQEAAIAGLSQVAGHEADSVYIRALRSSGHQVALAAAQALKDSPDSAALPALLDGLDASSAGRSENARDPRMAMLERIAEIGTAAAAPRLQPYLADYDTLVAATAAATLTRWTGTPVEARPAPLAIRSEPLARVFLGTAPRLRVTMARSSGGGSFTVRLFPREAPATVARVLRLAREGFYDGKVFQRVEPNFVIQGGGPDANEYVGDSTFMRDELTMRTHARGTLGISARGRDTGDGQWFINLVDNPLLDHEYTVFGRIDGGREVAERILEGDRIERVEIPGER
jgi:cyclophilin family peptidyl-prolyl cis-trans isomerase/HEAT repeat protein